MKEKLAKLGAYAIIGAFVVGAAYFYIGSSSTPPKSELAHIEPNQEKAQAELAQAQVSKPELKYSPDVKILPVEGTPTLVLGKRNTLVFKDVVTRQSVGLLQRQAFKLSQSLKPSDPIFLVLETPGGSIDAGNSLIDSLQGLPNKVHTVTLFAASMGFHIVESLNTRLITPSGILMSHRAKIGGLAGEVPGEAVTEINYILRQVTNMDKRVVSRIGMDLKDYQRLIADEYWVDGQDAVDAGMADKVVLVRCDNELNNSSYEQTLQSFFGAVTLTWSACPLVSYPIKVDMSDLLSKLIGNPKAQEIEAQMREFIYLFIYDKKEFVKKYVQSNRYSLILQK